MAGDEIFKDWFKQRRKSLDVTQEEFARQVGCSVATIRGMEQGALRPSRQLAELVAAALEVLPEDRPAFVQWARGVGVRQEPPVASFPVSTQMAHGGVAAPPIPALAGNGGAQLAVVEPANPYKGLRAFQEADAPDFFGREALVERLYARLGEESELSRFLAVVGPSGAGKSSLVRAGLIPLLRRAALPGGAHPLVVNLIPGSHPFEELEASLLRVAVNPPGSLIEQLRADERGLARAVKRVLPDDEQSGLLLVIDQFEELFTEVADERVRADFIDSLFAAVGDQRSRLWVVVTLRADFYDRPLLYLPLTELLNRRSELVGPLSSDELYRAITAPAHRVGLELESGLVATILLDVAEQPGALPLVQYTLTELFERRAGHMMTLEAYQASGGVIGSLARRAESLYEGLTEQEQVAARQLFLRLVTPGQGVEDTRRRVLMSEVSSAARYEGALQRVLDLFGRYRMLTFDRDPVTRGPTVEVAHEALLRTWSRLREWLDDSRVEVRVQRLLTGAAAEWASAGHDLSYLATGARLAQFAALAETSALALNQDELAFVNASQEQAERQATEREAQRQRELEQARALAEERTAAAARLRRRALYLAGVMIVALLAAVAAGIFARTAQENFVRSEQERLASEANLAIAGGESGDLPALLAIRSLHYGASAQAVDALQRALSRPFTVQRFIGHTGAVYGVAFSPDGRQVLTGSYDKTARLWDAATGQQLRVFSGHTDGVRTVAFSPDGKYILTGGLDATARLWDTATSQELRQFIGHERAVWSVQFSPDGKQILTASIDHTARLWDVATAQEVRRFTGHTAEVWWAAFSPDGKQVLTGSQDRTALLWDVATGRKVGVFTGHTASVNGVAFAPDGKQVFTTSDDHTARLWDVATGQEVRQFTGHADVVVRVAFSPDGRYVLTGSYDKTARLWDVATGQQLYLFSGHTAVVFGVAFSPDGKQVLTGSTDGTVRLWDALPTTDPRIFFGHTDEVHAVALSPDGKYVLTASADKTARLWDAHSGQLLRVFLGHTDIIWSAAFSSNSRYVITGADAGDPTARLWDAQTGQQLHIFQHGGWVSGTVLSPDGQQLFTGSGDGYVRLWDVATEQELRRFGPAVTMGYDKAARLVNEIAVSPGGKEVVTVGDDKIVRLWDVATGQQLRIFTGHTGRIWSVAFSPDGKYILTGSDNSDATARLWDVATGQQLRIFHHNDGIRRVVFSPDSKEVLTGSVDQTAALWDAATGQQLRVFSGHTAAVYGVAFSSDGKQVLTGSVDRTARLWHIDAQSLIPLACARLTRDLTPDERTQYGIRDQEPTCPAP